MPFANAEMQSSAFALKRLAAEAAKVLRVMCITLQFLGSENRLMLWKSRADCKFFHT